MTQILPAAFSPALILIIGGLLAGFLPRALRNLVGLATVVISIVHLLAYGFPGFGEQLLFGERTLSGLDITMIRVDRLSMIFSIAFHIAAMLNVIYGWRHATRLEFSMGLIYAGAAIGGTLAGDLLTLFIYWELAALSSVFIVWAGGGHSAFKAGMRYFVFQVVSGLCLLAGLVMHYASTGSVAFNSFITGSGALADLSPAAVLILVAFAIKAAFPLVHTWLQDSYPKASAVGTVLLSAFTTKMAIYTLARGFAGLDALIVIGCIMTAFPVFFALIENDLRKVLAYSLNNQLGFMVCAIGIGTPLALNGAASHAFVHIIYKALLFMSMGAVLVRTGTTKASELGGLHKSMPWTTVFCIIGAMSISAFPLFSGFVAKSMITLAASEAHLVFAYLVLLFASAGVLEHSGIKIPFFAFFAHDQYAPSITGKPRPAEAPAPMIIAMGLAAFLCIFIGVQPQFLMALQPFEAEYQAYTQAHVVTQMQLLLFAILAFALLVKFKLYPPELPSVNLDVDWLWRVPGRIALMGAVRGTAAVWHKVWWGIRAVVGKSINGLYTTHGPEGGMARSWTVGYTALTTAGVLGVVLLAVFFLN
ncbi:Na(+)/H(+) antiporter subunit D [Parvularcula sp. LCG005]|uniref:Na(+)/H(+) antiporter subunit D n=1 Tax=Parvularcula sp. LCG005 TaxID=3078805 RepID=UPI00294265A1|nr:Na(+)/H(+) antiporter subunit D [Parvularcula sp. LCG005]WOI53970.1 Na(+)/H(+) antiporter subunit D [Parvularcula sp. LCG005]